MPPGALRVHGALLAQPPPPRCHGANYSVLLLSVTAARWPGRGSGDRPGNDTYQTYVAKGLERALRAAVTTAAGWALHRCIFLRKQNLLSASKKRAWQRKCFAWRLQPGSLPGAPVRGTDTRFGERRLQTRPCDPLICPQAAAGGNGLGLTRAMAHSPWKWGNGWGGARAPSCCKPQITAAGQHTAPLHGRPRQPGTCRPIFAISAGVTTISRLPKPAVLPLKALLHSEPAGNVPQGEKAPSSLAVPALGKPCSGSCLAAPMVGMAQGKGCVGRAESPAWAGKCRVALSAVPPVPAAGAGGLVPTAPAEPPLRALGPALPELGLCCRCSWRCSTQPSSLEVLPREAAASTAMHRISCHFILLLHQCPLCSCPALERCWIHHPTLQGV